ncbi:MAG: hypothetical protein KYX69_19795 [Sphingomonas sp.]|uniref:hypothetical protein n=1 Tax=Sphingomonas sp. TaxID=28214 RepID=UPI0026199665|nr:hypothetical protein [Sphingomonas sp.]MDK2769948.1 hypothetical protein [Sphingomonas sp.]
MSEIPADITETAKRIAGLECRCTEGCGDCADGRAEIIAAAIFAERERCRRIAKFHSHHALWAGLLPYPWDVDTEKFGIGLAQRISKSIGGKP